MKGKITSHNGSPYPNSYMIQGEDGGKYFAHIGDLKNNEDILYRNPTVIEVLQDGDEVEFEVPSGGYLAVYHVKKSN